MLKRLVVLIAICGGASSALAQQAALRPPAVPLVTHDPYFSIWSPHDRLTDGDTSHWTGSPQRLTALVRIDGKAYRLMGAEPKNVEPLTQSQLQVTPTRTVYSFEHPSLSLSLTFLTPALPDDLDVLSRPVTYLTVAVQAKGDARPAIQFYLDANAELAVNKPDQTVRYEHVDDDRLHVLRVGTVEQAVLDKQGDDMRIDWGYFYLAAARDDGTHVAIAPSATARAEFLAGGKLPDAAAATREAAAGEAEVLALTCDLGQVGDESTSRTALLAYDDLFSIRYFDADLQPYWRRNGTNAVELLNAAVREQAGLTARCETFDRELLADAERVGGPGYAKLIALCHRQSLAGTKLVADADGQPLFFTKENFSNGCIGTVDVFYPQAPHLLLLSPALMKATLVPILDYAASPRWKFDFAPHDLGRYPHATGQVYGGGERTLDRQMMVEESANMLLLIAVLAQVEGNADLAKPYWAMLEKWADYLEQHGYDPENQLCTDDFAGHLARNVNLSAKAICALGAFGQLADLAGKPEQATKYSTLAREMAGRWSKDADDAGTHTRLGFGMPGTWSQKYNLSWDRVLDLELFPKDAIARELSYYRSVSNPYGLPLDSRSTYTKLDWILWTAALAENRGDFEALLNPVLKFINETPDRIPLTDWYFTDTAKWKGFKARPVVGGVFMPLLTDAAVWKKWSTRGENTTQPWAPLPIRPVTVLAPTGEEQATVWRVNWNKPRVANWNQPGFLAPSSAWVDTEFPVGVEPTVGIPVRTKWESPELWAIREFELAEIPSGDVYVLVAHSAPFELWLNGVSAVERTSREVGYQKFRISEAAAKTLKSGTNTLALHTRVGALKPQGRAVIDVGLVSLDVASRSVRSRNGGGSIE